MLNWLTEEIGMVTHQQMLEFCTVQESRDASIHPSLIREKIVITLNFYIICSMRKTYTCCCDVLVNSFNKHVSISYRFLYLIVNNQTFVNELNDQVLYISLKIVKDNTSNTTMSRSDKVQDRFAIVFPFFGQIRSEGVLAARQFQRDFETVGVDVVEILHSTFQIVPVSAVGDAVLKDSAFFLFLHCRIAIGVVQRQHAEDFIIRRCTVIALRLVRSNPNFLV